MAGKTITEAYMLEAQQLREREERLRILAVEHLARTLNATASTVARAFYHTAQARPLGGYGDW